MCYMTLDELQKIRGLLECLRIKCKTDPLYRNTVAGIAIIDREIKLKTMNPVKSDERSEEGNSKQTEERKEADNSDRTVAKDTGV